MGLASRRALKIHERQGVGDERQALCKPGFTQRVREPLRGNPTQNSGNEALVGLKPDLQKDTSKNSLLRDEAQGARSAGTGVYTDVHEDSEHRATQRFACKMNL